MGNKNYKFAVLLAAYNGKSWIKEQIDSILNQRGVDLKIFISIDKSKDGTREYLEELFKNNKRICLLDDTEPFGGAAKNFYRLIRDVDFKDFNFISLADQDDIWNEDKLINAVNIINGSDFEGYSSNVLAFWEDGATKIIDKAQKQTSYDHLFESPGPGCTFVLSKNLGEDVKAFILNKWEKVNQIEFHDWFIYSFCRENGYKWFIDSTSSMKYRQHVSNQVGANNGFDAKIKRLKMVLSSWYRNETKKIIEVLEIDNKYTFIKYINNKSYINNLILLPYTLKFRRKFKEKVNLFILCLLGIY